MAYATSQVRRDVSTNWNPTTVLLDGELGFETDTGKLKVGYSGITWGSLGYVQGATGATGPSVSYLNSVPTSGQFYESFGVGLSGNTNTQLTSQSVTITSSTAKVLITAQATLALNTVSPIYATIGQYTSAGPNTATTNLARSGVNMTTDISGPSNRLWGQASNNNQTTVSCSVIDTPGIGTWWYSLWVRTGGGTASAQYGTIIILQVAP
jgi:hypothetical protein